MIKYDIIKDILVFLFVYIPPLIIFIKFWRERNRSRIILVMISLLYIILSFFTNNLLPFILVVFDIKYIKDADKMYGLPMKSHISYDSEEHGKITISNRVRGDFNKFGFDIGKFSIISAIKFTTISYLITIIISVIEAFLISEFKVQVTEQEVVTWMANMPVKKFLILIPIIIIFAPILEEFVFRWLLFEKIFRPRMGIYLSALLSSIIFSVIHFNIRAFPLLICIGLYNCYLIEKKGYWYAVFNHFTFNFITAVVLLIQKLKILSM